MSTRPGKAVGGYFSAERRSLRSKTEWHLDGTGLASGRACLSLLLDTTGIKKAYLPFYSCDSLSEPFRERDISTEFYEITSNFRPADDFQIDRHGIIVLINYFGLLDIGETIERFNGRVWVDNSHAFFSRNTPQDIPAFSSARKFFGVPDGAILSGIDLPETVRRLPRNENYRLEHLLLRDMGDVALGLEYFRLNEKLINCDIKRMSRLSESVLGHIDFDDVARIRRQNFAYLHQRLGKDNTLSAVFPGLVDQVPFCYPYLPETPIDKRVLWERGVYTPELWRDCMLREDGGFVWERRLSAELLPLPVDHRYGQEEMQTIVDLLKASGDG